MATYNELSTDQLHDAVLQALEALSGRASAGEIACKAAEAIVARGEEQSSPLLVRALKDQIWQMVDRGKLEWTVEGPIVLRDEPTLVS